MTNAGKKASGRDLEAVLGDELVVTHGGPREADRMSDSGFVSCHDVKQV
jgi:hypothetical protein